MSVRISGGGASGAATFRSTEGQIPFLVSTLQNVLRWIQESQKELEDISDKLGRHVAKSQWRALVIETKAVVERQEEHRRTIKQGLQKVGDALREMHGAVEDFHGSSGRLDDDWKTRLNQLLSGIHRIRNLVHKSVSISDKASKAIADWTYSGNPDDGIEEVDEQREQVRATRQEMSSVFARAHEQYKQFIKTLASVIKLLQEIRMGLTSRLA
ncbi:MAG: hypothetical protein ACFFCO_05315 [Promethearchaeota archaeon]